MKKLISILTALLLLCGTAFADGSSATITYSKTSVQVGEQVTANYVITGIDPRYVYAYWCFSPGDNSYKFEGYDFNSRYWNRLYRFLNVRLTESAGSSTATADGAGYITFEVRDVDTVVYPQNQQYIAVTGAEYPVPDAIGSQSAESAKAGDTITWSYELTNITAPREIRGELLLWYESVGYTHETFDHGTAMTGTYTYTVPEDLPSDAVGLEYSLTVTDQNGYETILDVGHVKLNGTFTGDPGETPDLPEPPHSEGTLHLDEDGIWRCYDENGEQVHTTGLVIFDGAAFVVADGVLQTNANGLVLVNGNWLYASQGQVQSQYTGLVQYDGAWFYVANGAMDTELNGLIDYDGGRFLVSSGSIRYDVNGLWQNAGVQGEDGEWYFLANGQVQNHYTGLVLYDGAWFYLVDGKLAAGYTGTVEYDGATFQVVNGQVVP